MAVAKRKKGGVGQTVGSILVGFDQAVFRTLPPAEELVHHARPDDPVPAGGGSDLLIELPHVVPPAPLVKRRRRRASLTGG